MSGYKRKDLQILGGGFNCLPPSDKTPQTDYLQAQNWRVDRLGNLVSRFGYPQKFSITGAGLAHSAFVNGGISGDYYVGCNASIGTPTPSKLYWQGNASEIATGFDGGRIGMAAMDGWVWFMNRTKQGRHKASLGAGTSQAWNLTAPASSCAAASVGAPVSAASVTYTYAVQSNPNYWHSLVIAGVTYQFDEGTFAAASDIAGLIAQLAAQDPNCTVTHAVGAATVVITPKVAATAIAVSGSDSNADATIASGGITSLPSGTYTFYVTFESADEALESNGGPSSNAVALTSQAAALTAIPVSGDARCAKRNIYAAGGTLGQPYRVGSIPDNSTTTFTVTMPDLAATNNGIVMPINNDPPPAAAGLIGPHFSRLFAWATAANPNRLFYTDPDMPQYWPGANDPAVGNWVDVGAEGEAIVWCTMHGNLLVIYKERSIWVLVGDPDSGTLSQVTDAHGLCGAFAVVAAGLIDYFVAPNGLCTFDMDRASDDLSAAVRPLFQAGITGGVSPGSILAGTYFNANNAFPYAVALGYAMGKLYVGYAETASGTSYCLLVYHEASKHWFYHRNAVTGASGFYGFAFDGAVMCGLTGSAGGAALGLNLDDFRTAGVTDAGAAAIACIYQSHYEDGGEPDLQKKWLEAVIDYEFAGDTGTVYVLYDNGANLNAAAYAGGTTYGVAQWVTSGGLTYQSLQGSNVGHTPASSPTWWLAVPNSTGTITGSARKQTSFALGADGVLAKNISIQVSISASHLAILHNVYLYYYEEARLAAAASTLPTDLGVGKVKQCKELELDIDASGGNVAVSISSDLPGNALAVRQSPTVTANAGRALMKYPFSTAGPPPSYTEGYLWRVALKMATGPFRLYAARLLMRVVGVYVEAYEAAAGFVWDSMELDFESAITKIPRTFAIALAAIPIKRFREISLEIETFGGNVTVSFLTDLPGNAQAVRFTATVNTGTAGRRFFRLPLPGGVQPPTEGRMCRLQLSGAAKFVLYQGAVELLPVGVYIEAYEGAAGAVYDSREHDFGSAKPKEAREIELDIETTGAVVAQIYSDLPGLTMAQAFASQAVNTSGRQTVRLPLTAAALTETFVDGRLFRLILSGANAYRLYGARLSIREYGCYITADEASGGALWDSTPLDLGLQREKAYKRLELDLKTVSANAVTVTVLTSQSGSMAQMYQTTVNTSQKRTTVNIPLPPGIRGALVQVQVSGAPAGLYAARIWWRPLNEPQAVWGWADLPVPPTKPEWTWAPLPANPTPPGAVSEPAQWIWGKVLPVEETPETWTWVDVPFEVVA